MSRFGDVGVLAAVADRARATTVVTSEGRALTEIALLIQNRAQPFLKVTLPAGAAIVSVEVAGESAKPAIGTDGTRVPLLRPQFRPTGPYAVSFVYLHTSAPFTRRGDLRMALPRMDIPIGLMEWEVFVPDRYAVRQAGGNVMDGNLAVQRTASAVPPSNAAAASCTSEGPPPGSSGAPATLSGDVRDSNGRALPGVTVEARSNALIERVRSTTSDGSGRFQINALPPATYCLSFVLQGFTPITRDNVQLSGGTTVTLRAQMRVGSASQTVNVTAEAPVVDVQNARVGQVFRGEDIASLPARRDLPSLLTMVPSLGSGDELKGICSGGTGTFCNPNEPAFNSHTSALDDGKSQGRVMVDGMVIDRAPVQQSQNVVNLQRRVAGVLPVRVDVPRAGTSHWFVKPLVVDQEAAVTLKYKRQ